MQKKFSSHLFDAVRPVMEKIYGHPFIAEMADGSLSRERFCGYMQQDSLYLLHFARALAATGTRFSDEPRIAHLLRAAEGALLAERSLHAYYFEEFEVTERGEQNPACLGYSSFLLATAAFEKAEISAAALLPCFWIYREVGDHISRIAVSPNPYSKWIELYSDKDFSDSVEAFTKLTDELAEEATEKERVRMREFFVTASCYEYRFWDCAYRMEKMNSFERDD